MKISLKAQGTLWLLRTYGRMTLQQILEHCTDGRDAAKAALRELKKAELVAMSKVRSGGRFEVFVYTLTNNGKPVRGEPVENPGFLDVDTIPMEENPSKVRPVAENPSMAEVVENKSIILPNGEKSASGDQVKDSLYISNKGNSSSKYIEIVLYPTKK